MDFPSFGSLLKWQQLSDLGQYEARNLELHLSLPCGDQVPKDLCHLASSPRY